MNTSQRPSTPIFVKATFRQRWIAAAVVLSAAGLLTFLLMGAEGWLDSASLLGVCGFQQRTGLPCPGCYWTRAGQAFVTGHILRSFYMQPAAAVFYSLGSLAAFFALLCALFGIQFGFLNRFRSKKVFWTMAAAGAGLVLAAWALEILRTILGVELV